MKIRSFSCNDRATLEPIMHFCCVCNATFQNMNIATELYWQLSEQETIESKKRSEKCSKVKLTSILSMVLLHKHLELRKCIASFIAHSRPCVPGDIHWLTYTFII